MEQPPRGRDALFSPQFRLVLATTGIGVGVAATCAYVLGRELAPNAAQTMAFATIALAELALVFSFRSTVDSAWRGPRNASLAWSVLVSILVVALALYVPSLAEALGTTPLDAPELGIVVALALLPAALFEAVKALRRPRTS